MSDIGSFHNVQLLHNGRKIITIDVYGFILKSYTQDDIRFQKGNAVIVTVYKILVKISGKIKPTMRFDMKKDELLVTLISYAGSFETELILIFCV